MDVKSNNPQLQVDVSDEVLLQIAHHALTLIPGYHSLNSNFTPVWLTALRAILVKNACPALM